MLSGAAAPPPPGAGAVLQVEMRVIAVEQRFVEAAVQPAAPFAMQCRGEEVADAGEARILEEHEEDQQGGAGQQRRQRRRILGIVEEAIELTRSPEASASQTLALLDSAVSRTITSVSPQASFQRSENQ